METEKDANLDFLNTRFENEILKKYISQGSQSQSSSIGIDRNESKKKFINDLAKEKKGKLMSLGNLNSFYKVLYTDEQILPSIGSEKKGHKKSSSNIVFATNFLNMPPTNLDCNGKSVLKGFQLKNKNKDLKLASSTAFEKQDSHIAARKTLELFLDKKSVDNLQQRSKVKNVEQVIENNNTFTFNKLHVNTLKFSSNAYGFIENKFLSKMNLRSSSKSNNIFYQIEKKTTKEAPITTKIQLCSLLPSNQSKPKPETVKGMETDNNTFGGGTCYTTAVTTQRSCKYKIVNQVEVQEQPSCTTQQQKDLNKGVSLRKTTLRYDERNNKFLISQLYKIMKQRNSKQHIKNGS